jgi:hypothetical protein
MDGGRFSIMAAASEMIEPHVGFETMEAERDAGDGGERQI